MLTYNRYEINKYNIEHIMQYNKCELIIIDNNSTDYTKQYLKNLKKISNKNVKVVLLNNNTGVPEARNIGASLASCEYLIFIDNDIIIKCNFYDIIQPFIKNDNIAIVGARILGVNDSKIDTWVYNISQKKYSENSFYTYTFSGGAVAIKKDIFLNVGGYDGKLFFSQEEKDISMRILNANYKIIYFHKFLCIHHHIIINKITGDNRLYYNYVNNLIIMYKNLPIIYFMLYILNFLVRKGYYSLRKNKLLIYFNSIRKFLLVKKYYNRNPISRKSFKKYLFLKKVYVEYQD